MRKIAALSHYEKISLILSGMILLLLFRTYTACSGNRAAELATVTQSRDMEAAAENPRQEHITRSLLPGEKININTADCYDLERLPGIGAGKAENIVDYRRDHGPFPRLNSLLLVDGINERIFAGIREHICLEGGTE